MSRYGFWYAGGRLEKEGRKPASAFSQGDLLGLDSNSSLSRLNPYAIAAGTVYAVAGGPSTDSIDDLCTVTLVTPQTYFWSRVSAGADITTGEESEVSFVAAAPERYWVEDSTGTNAVVVRRGTDIVDQSNLSKVQVVFKYADSELDLS